MTKPTEDLKIESFQQFQAYVSEIYEEIKRLEKTPLRTEKDKEDEEDRDSKIDVFCAGLNALFQHVVDSFDEYEHVRNKQLVESFFYKLIYRTNTLEQGVQENEMITLEQGVQENETNTLEQGVQENQMITLDQCVQQVKETPATVESSQALDDFFKKKPLKMVVLVDKIKTNLEKQNKENDTQSSIDSLKVHRKTKTVSVLGTKISAFIDILRDMFAKISALFPTTSEKKANKLFGKSFFDNTASKDSGAGEQDPAKSPKRI